MEINGVSFIEDWKVVFKALNIVTVKFEGLLTDTADGTLMWCVVDNDTLKEFCELDEKVMASL